MDAAQYKNAKANVFVHSYATTLTETWSITVGEALVCQYCGKPLV